MQHEVDIMVNGRPVRKYAHNSNTFVRADKGSRYSIRVKNDSSERIMTVITVDSINIVNGEAGGTGKVGYVLSGYSSHAFDGFRTSNEVVHPFMFSDKESSYAAKSDATGGDTGNCGVIGVRIYTEKPPRVVEKHIYHTEKEYVPCSPWYPRPNPWKPHWGDIIYSTDSTGASHSSGHMMRSCSMNAAFSSSNQSIKNIVSSFDMGTEFSKEEVQSHCNSVEFDTGRLVKTVVLFYASESALLAMGVQMTKEVTVAVPQAFPTGFCKVPKD